MKKVKITLEQYKRLFESTDVTGGLNRVNNDFSTAIAGKKVQKLSEEPFDIKAAAPGVPNSAMKQKPEKTIQENENVGAFQAIHDFIEQVWMNPLVKKTIPFFAEAGVNWDDVANYLASKGILADVGEKGYKVKNYYKTPFSKDAKEAMHQKMQDIDKLSKMLEKDPKAPWNVKKVETNSKTEMSEVDATPQQTFTPVAMGLEIFILNGPNGKYVFSVDDISKEDLPVAGPEPTPEDVLAYINSKFNEINKGEGVRDFEAGKPLVKIDDALKNELLSLYSKDKKIVAALKNLEEMTSAAGGSSGAFVGPLGSKPSDNMITRGYSRAEEISEVEYEEETIEEVTSAAGGSATSSSTGAYVQPAIWAKNKKNWAPSKKTQYPHGEMVDFDPCTKLNNNKAAQNGKCSQGAVDHVVKTHGTKQSVISKTVYEQIAEKTGRSVEDIKKVIETKLNNGKSLS